MKNSSDSDSGAGHRGSRNLLTGITTAVLLVAAAGMLIVATAGAVILGIAGALVPGFGNG